MKLKYILLTLFLCLPFISDCREAYSDEVKPLYNIWVTNQTDDDIVDIEILYGDEHIKTELIESLSFKWRSFVNYAVPKDVIFKWKDTKGTAHNKKVKVPPYKLDINYTSNLFITIDQGNNIVIEWKEI